MVYWTDDINDEQVLSPVDIMLEAAKELERRTKRLQVDINLIELKDRVVCEFEVKNLISDRRFKLFDISHRLNEMYPAVINPPKDDVPEFLQRERLVPGTSGASLSLLMRGMVEGTPDRQVTNEWVCATPVELRSKLIELLSEEYVRSIIISLLASDKTPNIMSNDKSLAGDGEDETTSKDASTPPEIDT